MIESLDPLRLPLRGSRLIEASAGTGKTWTIAALVVRLVLDHGGADAAFGEALDPGRILVVTFTRAATKELAGRIRERLAHAAACMRGERGPESGDAFLSGLLADYPPGPAREAAAWRLAAAADAMDCAAVLTIDAWCQRTLREHALASAAAFDETVLADPGALQRQAALDVWRRDVYALDGEALDGVLGTWADAEAFAHAAQAWRDDGALDDEGEAAEAGGTPGLGALWDGAVARRREALAPLKRDCAERLPALHAWLAATIADKNGPIDRKKLNASRVDGWFAQLRAWTLDAEAVLPGLTDTAWERLSHAGLRAALREGASIDPPAEFDALRTLRRRLAALPEPRRVLRRGARARVAARALELKQSMHSYGFVDLQRRLAAALQGPGGADLAARLRAQYPVALIDEFQDTSALQYALFDRVYDFARADEAGVAVLLIGDPKQSIYGFRGADIAGYLQARRATHGRHHVLGTNFRSTRPLVDAVNRLFEHAEQAAGAGAFGFRTAQDDPVAFVPVAARGRQEVLVAADGVQPAMRYVHLDALETRDGAGARLAGLAAESMVGLLNDPACGWRRPDGGFTRLRPADCAVLVRNRHQAAEMRAALQARGIASVFLSDKGNVLASSEAADVLRLLRAVAQPRDVRLARAALATATLGLDLSELARMARDDAAFEARAELLSELHAVWQRQGVLPMLRLALHRLELPGRWLHAPDGERRLTNVLHLAELLQRASAGIDGEAALVRWLTEAIADAGDGAAPAEEQLPRLESEADLVKIVTIHQSKGLEYPLVWMPFACDVAARRPAEDDDPRGDDEDCDRGLEIDAADDADDTAPAVDPEDIRLLYVALTRARHALWIGAAVLGEGRARRSTFARSALGALLGRGGDCAPERLGALLESVFAGLPQVRVEPAAEPPVPPSRLATREAEPALTEPVPYAAVFERDWRIGSFTALTRGIDAGARQASLQNLEDVADGGSQAPASAAARHAFPRGAFVGTFLHEQLAWLARQDLAAPARPALRTALARRCEMQGWGHRAAQVGEWFDELLDTPLPPLGAPLHAIGARSAEMEFWFPVHGGVAARLGDLCARRLLPGRTCAPLGEQALRGLMMGFIDLVFFQDDRWWVLDYKSNALGQGDEAYGPDALADAVAAHRYDVQATLYLLALHRLLRARLGDAYDPARQLGGAIDLFMRGIGAPGAGCFTMPLDLELLERVEALVDGDGHGDAGEGA